MADSVVIENMVEHGRQCSTKFSITLYTEILSTEIKIFLKQIVFLKSFNSVLQTWQNMEETHIVSSLLKEFKFIKLLKFLWSMSDIVCHAPPNFQ